MSRNPTPAAPWSERAAALVVTALPAGVALARLAHAPTWREDAALLRDVVLVGTGAGGGVSTALAQITGALPLGTLTFRAAVVSVLALAVASRLGFSLALRLLRTAQRGATQPLPTWLAPAFAAIAVCGAALSPSVQLEATVAGGATVAAALAMAALVLVARAADPAEDTSRGRDVASAGVLVGATLAERPLAAVAAASAIAALLFTHRASAWLVARWPRRTVPARPRLAPIAGRAITLGLVLASVAAVVVALPALLRPLAPGRALDLGFGALPGSGEAALTTTAVAAWVAELGWTPLALGGLGAAALLLREATRPGAAALVALIALDVLVPAPLAGGALANPAAALRTLAIVALAVLAAFGLHEGVARLLRARVPYARPAAVLLVAFQATLVALTSEQASAVSDRAAQRGAEEWLDASRASFEARSVVLVRRPQKALHLWTAQLAGGFRPDLVVAATELLPRPGVASELLARAPRAHDLVRTTALRGAADEYALGELADASPLHVEPDRAWDGRTASHVELDGVWVRFVSHPIGRTDRKRSAEESVAPLSRVLASIDPVEAPDPATTEIVAITLREQALLLARLGETDTARSLAATSRRLGPSTSVGSPAAAVLLASLELMSRPGESAPAKGRIQRIGHR